MGKPLWFETRKASFHFTEIRDLNDDQAFLTLETAESAALVLVHVSFNTDDCRFERTSF
jgi:hypothetical protein